MPRKPRIVIAGQIPPPTGGQNIMIARLLADFRGCDHFHTEHLAFRFTPEFNQARRFSLYKVLELLRIALNLLRIRMAGPIDWIIAPSGGPQTAPVLRDILLLPLLRLATDRLCIQFHAAGIADRLHALPFPLSYLLRAAYSGVDHAVVMTKFNCRDPEALGIRNISVIPYRIPYSALESFQSEAKQRNRLLCMGHICPDKGIDTLLEAFAKLLKSYPDAVLELAGEPIPPWDASILQEQLAQKKLDAHVKCSGVLHEKEKQSAFSRASIFVFPSRAPYESFGLVTAEAMMAGLPIVATDWRGNRDVAAGSSGVIWSPSGNPDALADALRTALNRHAEHAAMGKTNHEIFCREYLHTGKLDPRWNEVLHLIPTSSG